MMTTSGKRPTPVMSHLIFTFPVKESCEVAPSPAHAVPNCKSPVLQVKWQPDTFSRNVWYSTTILNVHSCTEKRTKLFPHCGLLTLLGSSPTWLVMSTLSGGVFWEYEDNLTTGCPKKSNRMLLEPRCKCSITCAWKDVFGRFTKTKQDQVLPRRVYWKIWPHSTQLGSGFFY